MARKQAPAIEDLRSARASLAVGAQLSDRERTDLLRAADYVLGTRPRGRPVDNQAKKQLAVLKMQATFPTDKAPTDGMIEKIAEEFGLEFDAVDYLYRQRVLPSHRIRAIAIGASRNPRANIKSRKNNQSKK